MCYMDLRPYPNPDFSSQTGFNCSIQRYDEFFILTRWQFENPLGQSSLTHRPYSLTDR